MVNEKNIDPKKIIIMIIAIILALILKNLIIGTLCIEEYQIAKCPNDLYLSSYYIQAENEEDANNKVKAILEENNFNLSNYEIIIESNNIKINEKETKETNEEEKTGTEKQETEEINTIQDNNLEIENESVEFNENSNAPEKSITNGFKIVECPESLTELKGKYIRGVPENYNDLFEKVKAKIIEAGKNKEDYEIQVKWGDEILTEERYNEIVEYYDITYIKVYIYNKQQTGETTETTEGGGIITSEDIKDFKEIGMCICVLLAIIFIYNFANSMFKRY